MSYMTGAIAGLIAGVAGATLAYLLIKDEKKRRTFSFLFFILFFFLGKTFLLPYYYAATFESDIKSKYPLMTTIANLYPAEFQKYIELSKTNIINNGSFDNDIKNSGTLINNALMKSVPYASNQTIYNYLSLTLQMYKKYYSIDSRIILALEFPNRVTNLGIISTISDSELETISNAKAAIIQSAATNKGKFQITKQDTPVAADDLQKLFLDLVNKYGKDEVEDTFLSTSLPFKNPQISVLIILSFYENLISYGVDRCGYMFKFMSLVDKQS